MKENNKKYKNSVKRVFKRVISTFGTVLVKLIQSTSNVTNVNGSGNVGDSDGILTCWWTTHTANRSMSSIRRPRRTLPKKVTYLSRIASSLLNGINAEVNESCIVRGGKSSKLFGSCLSRYSRLLGNTDQSF